MKSIGLLDVGCFRVGGMIGLLSFCLTVADCMKLEITAGRGYFAIGKSLFGEILAHILQDDL